MLQKAEKTTRRVLVRCFGALAAADFSTCDGGSPALRRTFATELESSRLAALVVTRSVASCRRVLGMRSMFADGMLKAMRGITTPDEVLRVTRDG
jgi:hypothetical protein